MSSIAIGIGIGIKSSQESTKAESQEDSTAPDEEELQIWWDCLGADRNESQLDQVRADMLQRMAEIGDMPAQLDELWEGLGLVRPDRMLSIEKAFLNLAKRPEAATQFLATRLKPITLSDEEFEATLKNLASEDEAVSKSAFERFTAQDPRLCMNVGKIMERLPEDQPVRLRMIEILSDEPWKNLEGKTVVYQEPNEALAGFHSFNAGDSMWSVPGNLDDLVDDRGRWDKEIRSLILLEAIGTNEAARIIETVATGHADLPTTKLASLISESIKDEKQNLESNQSGSATDPNKSQLESWWEDMGNSPWDNWGASERKVLMAILKFAKHPENSINFFADKLKPLKLDLRELRTLVNQLRKDDEDISKAAFKELSFLDPRLFTTVDKLMKQFPSGTANQRLSEILLGNEWGSLEGFDSAYVVQDKGDWKRHVLEKVETKGWALVEVELKKVSKAEWVSVLHALTVLESIGTGDAIELIEKMASGNEQVKPTKRAKEILQGIKSQSSINE